jgi:Zn-dependent protease with chaperone function
MKPAVHTLDGRAASRAPRARVPGPIDRTTFFEEQKRQRRAARRFSAVLAIPVAVFATGISGLLAPALYFIAAIVVRLAGVEWPMSEAVHTARQQLLALLEPIAAGAIGGDKAAMVGAVYRSLGAMLVPSIVIVLILWLAVRETYRRAGVGGMLLSLGAREPRPDDFEEHRLINVIGEMAIAAGVPPPRVRVLDIPISNAAVIGAAIEDAWIVVTRGLLDDFNREEVQGVVGHLIGSVGNGDLHLSITILSVFQTAWLLCALLDAPFRRRSRRAVWQFVKLVFAKRGTEGAARDADRLIETLGANLDIDSGDPKSLALFLWLPMRYFRLGTKLYFAGFCGPFVATIWRRRRYLADATAIQLTRDPDGLAGALRKWQQLKVATPGGAWASHFFIVGGPSHPEKDRSADSGFGYSPLTPSLDRRIARLEAQGAAVASPEGPPAPKITMGKLLLSALLLPLLALLIGLLFWLIFSINFLAAIVGLLLTLLVLQ